MNGSLALAGGTLYLARHARSIEIRTYDLDGVRRGAGFTCLPLRGPRAHADGIAVDEDLRIHVADSAARALRCFTVFGRELEPLVSRRDMDAPGEVGEPVAVAVAGVEDDHRLLVGSRGERRHAVQVFDRRHVPQRSLRSRGDADACFVDVARVAIDGRFATVCDPGSGLVQVFRDHEFHFAFRAPRARGARGDAVPRAARRLSDGRFVVAAGGEGTSAVHLLSPNGVRIHTIAGGGERTGDVLEPTDLVVAEGSRDGRSRVAVVDRDGDRVQVFNLEGVCYGVFPDLPHGEIPLAQESP